jgi:thioesterase domain-containing protein/acyl carrier protein
MEKLPLTAAGKVDRSALCPPTHRENKVDLDRNDRPRDVLDKRLVGIWESVLKISPISRKDDFFELGGTSLQSVEVLLRIEELFAVSLPPSTLAEHNTIEKLSVLLANRAETFSPGVLIKLKESGHGRPLFLIHSGKGDVASYGLLARRLKDRPIYGLQSIGLHGESWPLTNLRAMAGRYLTEIISKDPTGPYLLAGTCMGGMIAFELAQMLVLKGKTVSFLGLMDTGFPLPKTWRKPWTEKAYILLSTPFNESWRALRWKAIRGLGWGRDNRWLPAYRRYVEHLNGRALRRYKPFFYAGKITLFITTGRKIDHEEDPRLMLETMTEKARIIEIPCMRRELFVRPAVDKLAQELERAIELSEGKLRSR